MRVLMGQFDPGMAHQGVIKLQTHRAPTCATDTKSAVSDVQHGTPMATALVINTKLFDALNWPENLPRLKKVPASVI